MRSPQPLEAWRATFTMITCHHCRRGLRRLVMYTRLQLWTAVDAVQRATRRRLHACLQSAHRPHRPGPIGSGARQRVRRLTDVDNQTSKPKPCVSR